MASEPRKTKLERLDESLARQERFERELAIADPATRAHLLSAWKEQIIADCVALLKTTDDTDCISNVDRAIALSMDITAAENKGPR